MNTNKLVEEDIARTKQLEEMEMILDSIIEKIKFLQEESMNLDNIIKKKKEKLEVKNGALAYVRDEKESVFNSLQNALTENKKLKVNQTKKDPKEGKKKTGFGLFSGVLSYFKKENFDSIDTLDGKIAKTNVQVNPKSIEKTFNNGKGSYFDIHSEFDAKTSSNQIEEIIVAQTKSEEIVNQINTVENETNEEQKSDSFENIENNHEDDYDEDGRHEDAGNDEYVVEEPTEEEKEMLAALKQNFGLLPEN